mgnify:CR=1 FL=1
MNNSSTIHKIRLSDHNRREVSEYVRGQRDSNPHYTVIDVGGAAGGNPAYDVPANFIVDIKVPEGEDLGDRQLRERDNKEEIHYFAVNINYESEWEKVLQYVEENGKFDFCLCTHTLEDVQAPEVAIKMFGRIAKEGYVAIPSKYRELSNWESHHYKGYFHHRWIYSIKDNELVAYPKLNFIEQDGFLSRLGDNSNDVADLSFFWKDYLSVRFMNDDHLGPGPYAGMAHYLDLNIDDIDFVRSSPENV